MERVVARMSPDESAAWLGLMRVSQLLPAALDTQLQRDAGITHFEFMALSALSVAPDRTLSLSAVAAQTNATPPRLSHVVRRLEERGLIDRIACPTDKRSTLAQITSHGRSVLLHSMPGHLATARSLVLDVLDPDQLAALAQAMHAIGVHLDPERECLTGVGEDTESDA